MTRASPGRRRALPGQIKELASADPVEAPGGHRTAGSRPSRASGAAPAPPRKPLDIIGFFPKTSRRSRGPQMMPASSGTSLRVDAFPTRIRRTRCCTRQAAAAPPACRRRARRRPFRHEAGSTPVSGSGHRVAAELCDREPHSSERPQVGTFSRTSDVGRGTPPGRGRRKLGR